MNTQKGIILLLLNDLKLNSLVYNYKNGWWYVIKNT